MARFYLAPGVYPEELDLSGRAQAIATSIGAIVLRSKKGPLKPTFMTNPQAFVDTFGKPDARWGFGHHSALAFLLTSQALWVRRVVAKPSETDAGVRGARHAGLVVHNDGFGAQASRTGFWPFASGRYEDYSAGSQQITLLKFSRDLVAANSTVIVIGDDEEASSGNEITSTKVFATDNDATLRAIALDLQTKINTRWGSDPLKNQGSVTVWETQGSRFNVSNDRYIRIVSPEDQILFVKSAATTLGTTQPTISVVNDPWLFEVYAENPGAWGNDVGVRLMNIDQGVRQRQKLTFSKTLSAGQSFQGIVTIGGQSFNTDTVTYATSNDLTMEAIKDAILNAFVAAGYTTADARVVNAGRADREIEITSPIDGPRSFTIEGQVNGTTPPTILVTETVTGVNRDDTFELHVYTRDNVNVPVEKHLVSFIRQTSGYGTQLQLEDVINVSGTRSSLIRVVYNSANPAGLLAGTLATEDTAIHWLNGGDDGTYPTAVDMKRGWADFEDRTVYAVRLLIGSGEVAPIVQNEMIRIAEKRRDAFAILDMPSAFQKTADALAHRRGDGLSGFNPNTSFGAVYTPDVKILDDFSNETLFVPPSGYVAAQFAESDYDAAEWFAPAGLNRGLVKGIIGLREEYTQGDVEQLFPKQINYILKKPGKGYAIMGAETLQSKASALSNINVRRLLITIEVSLVDALDYSIYEPHDPVTQFEVVQLCTNFLQPIKEGRGLYDYKVISNDTNNKSYHRDMGQLNVDLLLKPVLPVKFIRLRSVITRTGTAFEEILGLLESDSAVS